MGTRMWRTGSNRLALAKRLDAPQMTVRYLDAATAQDARTKGALINIAEGRGDSLDAAKVFRDSGLDAAGLQAEGVSLEGAKAKEGLALANLDPHLFSQVVSGELPKARAAVIGAGVESPEDQRALVDLLDAREKGGKRLTNDQVGEMIRLTNSAPKQTETQESLFGNQEMTRSLIPEKAEVSDYVEKRIVQEQRLFKAVGNETAAARLGESGNVIQAGSNAARAASMSQAQMLYQKLSTSAGPVNDALDSAASRIAKGDNSNGVKEAAYDEIKSQLLGQASRLSGAGQVPAERPEGVARDGGGGVGGGQLDTPGQQRPTTASSQEASGAGRGTVATDDKNRSSVPRGLSGGSQPEVGAHGPVFREFHHDAAGAIAKLREVQGGEAVGALHHPAVGDIDLVWGKPGTAAKDFEDGYGLSKILAKHPEVAGNLQGILGGMGVTGRTANRVSWKAPRTRRRCG